YEIAASELAAWLEQQGPGSWWSVDGDRFLSERVSFPCPASELAEALRRRGEPLLVEALPPSLPEKKQEDGQSIAASHLGALAAQDIDTLTDTLADKDTEDNRIFALCWKRDAQAPGWLLIEDKHAAAFVAKGKVA